MSVDDVKAEAARAKAAAERKIAELRDNQHLSQEGRRALIAVVIRDCDRVLEQLRHRVTDEAAADRRALEKKLWGNPAPGELVAWRDSLARVRALKDRDEAAALWRAADLSDDQQMLRAMVLSGRFGDLTARYETEHPRFAEAAHALRQFDRADTATAKLSLSMALSPPFAPELSGVNPGGISRLAAQADAG